MADEQLLSLMKIITIYAGIALVIVGLSLFLLFAVINPTTLKTDTSSCLLGGFGSGACDRLYGGILPEFFWENSRIFAILSILVAAFGAVLIAMDKLTMTRKNKGMLGRL